MLIEPHGLRAISLHQLRGKFDNLGHLAPAI